LPLLLLLLLLHAEVSPCVPINCKKHFIPFRK
jgi:hypothetical protein